MKANELTIYDNDACAYDFDEARRNLAESLDESPDEVSDSAVWDYIADETQRDYECEKANLDKPLEGGCGMSLYDCVVMYSFLLQGMGIATGDQFAAKIAEAYDLGNPKNREAYEIAKQAKWIQVNNDGSAVWQQPECA